jgi:hypothetical protein
MLKIPYIFYFMETTRELMHLQKLSLIQLKIMDIPACFIGIITLFDKALSVAIVRNF